MTLDSKALEAFTAYFIKNYPGPDTVIHDPNWHAPRIFRAAVHAMCSALPAGEVGELVKRLRETRPQYYENTGKHKFDVFWNRDGEEAATALTSLSARIAVLRTGLVEIMEACAAGRVCDDVAWFGDIETLFDRCASVLGDLLSQEEYDALLNGSTLSRRATTGGGDHG